RAGRSGEPLPGEGAVGAATRCVRRGRGTCELPGLGGGKAASGRAGAGGGRGKGRGRAPPSSREHGAGRCADGAGDGGRRHGGGVVSATPPDNSRGGDGPGRGRGPPASRPLAGGPGCSAAGQGKTGKPWVAAAARAPRASE